MAKLRKVRLTDVNHLLTCSICRGYLVDAITINVCMHSFCRVCILKHINILQKYSCPECNAEIRLSNLRSDYRLRSIAYKIIPGLVRGEEIESLRSLHEISSTAFSNCSEDKLFRNQYFFDQEEPISLSIQYHMESLGILDNSFLKHCNIPQIRYLLAPAAFKVSQIKKFLSSKYDLSYFKKPMQVDIIYENKILFDDFSLMDVAYIFQWKREAPMRVFYRIRRCEKGPRGKFEKTKHSELKDSRRFSSCFDDSIQIPKSVSDRKELHRIESNSNRHHNLKIIIAKKRISKNKNKKEGKLEASNWSDKTNIDFASKTYINKKNGKHKRPKSTLNSSSLLDKTEYSGDTCPKSDKNRNSEKNQIVEETESVFKPRENTRNINRPSAVVPKLRLSAIKTKLGRPPKSFHDGSVKKKVRFDDDVKRKSSPKRCEEEPDSQLNDQNNMDQTAYANSIGLQPVSCRKVDSLLLHRKRRKSKCGTGKATYRNQFQITPKLYDISQATFKIFNENENKKMSSSSLSESESIDLENKVINCQTLDQSNVAIDKTSGTSSSLARNGKEETSGYKYSLTEQKHFDGESNSIQSMILIPKLVFSKTSQVSSSSTCATVNASMKTADSRPSSTDNLQKARISASLSKVFGVPLKTSDYNTKPPTAKMGSPKQIVVSSSSSSFQVDPIRPHSIPASLKLSHHSQSPALENWLLAKRSLSIDESYSQNPRLHLTKNLKSTDSPGSGLTLNSQTQIVSEKKLGSGMLLLNKSSHQSSVVSVVVAPKIANEQLNKSLSLSTQLTKAPETKCGSGGNFTVKNVDAGYGNYPPDRSAQQELKTIIENSHSSERHDFRSNSDTFNLERYTLELRNDIAKLDHNLNMEKSFEDFWEAQKSNDVWQSNMNMADSTIISNNIRMQQRDSSVRAIPNPAIINLRGTSNEAAIRKKRTMMQEYAEIKNIISSMEKQKTEVSASAEIKFRRFSNNIEKRKMENTTETLNSEDKNNNKNLSQNIASVKPFASIFRLSESTQN